MNAVAPKTLRIAELPHAGQELRDAAIGQGEPEEGHRALGPAGVEHRTGEVVRAKAASPSGAGSATGGASLMATSVISIIPGCAPFGDRGTGPASIGLSVTAMGTPSSGVRRPPRASRRNEPPRGLRPSGPPRVRAFRRVSFPKLGTLHCVDSFSPPSRPGRRSDRAVRRAVELVRRTESGCVCRRAITGHVPVRCGTLGSHVSTSVGSTKGGPMKEALWLALVGLVVLNSS